MIRSMEEWKYSSMRSEIRYQMEISSQFHDLQPLYSTGKTPFSHRGGDWVIPQTRFQQSIEEKNKMHCEQPNNQSEEASYSFSL